MGMGENLTPSGLQICGPCVIETKQFLRYIQTNDLYIPINICFFSDSKCFNNIPMIHHKHTHNTMNILVFPLFFLKWVSVQNRFGMICTGLGSLRVILDELRLCLVVDLYIRGNSEKCRTLKRVDHKVTIKYTRSSWCKDLLNHSRHLPSSEHIHSEAPRFHPRSRPDRLWVKNKPFDGRTQCPCQSAAWKWHVQG